MWGKRFEIGAGVFFLFLAGYLIVGFMLGMGFVDVLPHASPKGSVNIPPDDYTNCTNLSRTDTARCLADYVSSFYKYRLTEKDVNFSDLKENGGDCLDWAHLYSEIGRKLGFQMTEIILGMRNASYLHAFAIMSDEGGYCLLDNQVFACINLNLSTVSAAQNQASSS